MDGDGGKRAAALRAAEMVEDGARVGLGTGSTAAHLIARLGERVREGLAITCVATSEDTARRAREAGIEVADLDEVGRLDLTIDGADQIDPALHLVKGGGGALLREKIVAAASDRMIVIADAGKAVETLGAFPLPVEIVPFGARTTRALVAEALAGLGHSSVEPRLREARGAPVRSDGGNLLIDLDLGRIAHPRAMSDALLRIPGVVETGLFLGMCDLAVLGRAGGGTEIREAPRS